MLLLIAALQVAGIALGILLFMRKPAVAAPDARLAQVPDALVALSGRLDAADAATRGMLADLRREHAENAQRHHASTVEAARHLREEVLVSMDKLGTALHGGLSSFRADNAKGAEQLRDEVATTRREIDARLLHFTNDAQREHASAREVLHGKLTELGARNQQSHEALRESMQSKLAGLGEDQRRHQDQLREAVQQRLDKLNQDNTASLEEMRKTVDEKLDATLNERLTASFSHVGEGLKQVNQGIGEMKALSTEVGDLKRVFSNVKARGIVGEFQLGQQLEQMFSREQYEKNVAVKPNSAERVDYALKVPQGSGTALFPIDAKFPREDWERLEHAYEGGTPEEIAAAGKNFERAIREQGKSICSKYIHEPDTLPHAIMFLPTEGLYAEVMRRPGLQQDLQHQCNVTIAGPSTLMAILTSFRMGFHTIAMERKGHEIEKVLGKVKTEFGAFGQLLYKVEKKVQETQNALEKVRGKTTTINRSLRSVTELPGAEPEESGVLLAFEEFSGGMEPQLAAANDE